MDSIFYTFSTVAQVVAGISAIVTALCIFRLQILESEVRQRVSEINSDQSVDTMVFTERERINCHIKTRNLGYRIKSIKSIDPDSSVYRCSRLKWLLMARSYVVRRTMLAFGVSLLVIMVSVAILAITSESLDFIVPKPFPSRNDLLEFGIWILAISLIFNCLALFLVIKKTE